MSDNTAVVGTGSLTGWTKQDFLDEIKSQREIVCNRNSTGEQRLDAIAKAASLVLMCGDEAFCNTLINMVDEMKARDRMMLDIAFKNFFK